jgi:hypothetical protein
VVSIDFTSSNGQFTNPASLHYIDPTRKKLNPYQEAIVAVGKVLEEYDSDHLYPIYGFGGVVRNKDGKFMRGKNDPYLLNLHPEEKEVNGLHGILQVSIVSLGRFKVFFFFFSDV